MASSAPGTAFSATTAVGGGVDVRRKKEYDGVEDGAENDAPRMPQKKFFRTRAHSNILNANDFWYPSNPAQVPTGEYFPGLAEADRTIRFVDVGCGYGSLLTELAVIFPTTPMLGIEIRPKVVEYVQRTVLALRHTERTAKAARAAAAGAPDADAPAGASSALAAAAAPAPDPPPDCENVWAVHNNAQRFMPNFFGKGQLTKLFFCFADPHFKKKNHRKRIVSTALTAEYAYCLAPGGLVYVITDVADLMSWLVEHLSASPLFERLPREALKADPTVPVLTMTDEGRKVQRNNGNMYIAVFRKRIDPRAPMPPPMANDNAAAALAASDAGYTPKAGGELRGMTW